jgi:hypothetical protein
MREAEWRACVNVEPMLTELHKSFGGDKLRVFGCVVYRRVWNHLDDNLRCLLEATEEWAVSAINLDQWQLAWNRYLERLPDLRVPDDAQAIRSLVTSTYSYVLSAVWHAAWRVRRHAVSQASANTTKQLDKAEKSWQAIVLRDLYGNPFRPISFSPEWRTSTAVALAQQMYESRDFSAMPILADALQEAGCDNDDILNHCRDASATHVRGCWVVDLVLDKS